MLNRLVELARAGLGEERRELFLAVSDLFVEGAERYNDREIVLFGEVLGAILHQTQVTDRAAVSERVAHVGRTPRALALAFAEDEAPVAAPVLRYSSVLTEDDLVAITGRKSDQHRIAIAQRETLPEKVTDALVDHGGDAVLETVTRNRGARFSGRATTRLADVAATNHRLAHAMIDRSDFPPAVIDNVIRIISPAARRALGDMARTDRVKLDEVVEAATDTMEVARLDMHRQRAEVRAMVVDVQNGRKPTDEVLSGLIRQKRVMDVIYVLAELAEVPEAHVSNALHKVNSTAIAVICRHLEISAAVYGELTGLRCERLCLGATQADQMLREYRDMTPGTADRALKFHQKRSSSRMSSR
ncbi:hypothetical protein ABB55_11245 [Prosthecomicrobium hirschii]|uniref:DUF2336 domain-containing protein n=1 Tax=Prosthecodimorpha hirschii TaxID=665126 RepID=A0A0P6VJN7_9HYPH|nr:DUF2336 domain-containing protein [Prosthecomicrobium hirschii]KPL52720.1 hypothetical protein ABB55_11245 [Prosthecomicrobium hirschii]